MSIVPQRPPDTPLMTFYAHGKYEKPLTISTQFKAPSAYPSYAATITDRNKRATDEIDIKPITQKQHNLSMYDPKKYLRPFDLKDAASKQPSNDYSATVNSLAFTRLMQKKKAIEDNRTSYVKDINPAHQVNRGQMVSTMNEFNQRKRHLSEQRNLGSDRHTHSIDVPVVQSTGKAIIEKQFQISRDENDYFNNPRIYTKNSNQERYKRQIPDYFRIYDDPRNTKDPLADAPEGLVSIISKNQGWITVTPRSMNRKKPVEKQQQGETTKTSILTPSWMQLSHQERNKTDFMMSTIQRIGVRAEANRTFLVDKDQPHGSVFQVGHFRHNVTFKHEVDKNNSPNAQPQRLMEWSVNEETNPKKKILTGKIGSGMDTIKTRSQSPLLKTIQ